MAVGGGRPGAGRLRLPRPDPHLLGLLGALLLSALAAWPLLAAPGLINTRAGGDSPFLLQRAYELQANLRAGAVPARWMPDSAYGLGCPFFNYYASLPYYLAAGLSLAGAGILWGIKLTQLLGFLGAAAAMYGLVADLVDDPWAATLAAAAYTFAPFHMANVYVRGDSLSEFYAFAFYALILWAIVRLRRAPTVGHLAFLSASYAGLMLTHNVSALIFTPLAGLALLAAALSAPHYRVRVLLAGAAAFLLGASVSAWFWVPALFERDAVSLVDMTTGYFNYAGHFRGSNLVQWTLLFDYTIDGRHTPFVIGGLQAALGALGLATIAMSWLPRRRVRWADLALLPLLAYAIWPITPSSAIVWARIPLLPMVQFPWRFLSIVALGTALVAGVALSRLGRWRWLAAPLALAAAISGVAMLRPDTLPLSEADITAERLQLYEHLTGNVGSTVRAEYLPAQAAPRPYTSATLLSGEPHPTPVAAEGTLGSANLRSWAPTEQLWEVAVASPVARLAFQTFAFPGWQATVDGKLAAIDPAAANGRIVVEVEQGRHQVALRLGATPLRAAGERSSLAAGLIVLGLALAGLWRSRRHWPRMVGAIAVIGAVVGAGALAGTLASRAEAVSGALSTETMDFFQMPYLHANPTGVAFGASTRLVGYELVPREARAGGLLRLRLHWQTGESGLKVTVRLTTAADAWLDPPALATSEVALAAVTEHTFTVPAEVAPGLALLRVEVSGPSGNLSPHTALGTTLGDTYLAPVRVAPPEAAAELPFREHLGKSLDLLHGAAKQTDRDELSVFLTWRPRAPLGRDYVTSLRLRDPRGRRVLDSELDVQPRYGCYPTSLWPVGVPAADYYELHIPDGTPPGEGYQVEVTLYEVGTLAKLGALRLSDVTLTEPTIDAGAKVRHAFEGGLALTEWKLERTRVNDGEQIVARTQWTALSAPLADASARLSLQDGQGREIAAAEEPLVPFFPPSRWPLHALVNDRLSLRVPPGTAAGEYRLQLQLLGPGGQDLGGWLPPPAIGVRRAKRNTTVPTFTHALGTEFGGLIRLPGYDLERTPTQLAFTFHWQAMAAPGQDYKVFLQCVDPVTRKVIAQRDAAPLDDTYPTGRWAPGEVVSDRLVLDMSEVPAGHYQLIVGWYVAGSGERLEPVGGSAPLQDRAVVLAEMSWP